MIKRSVYKAFSYDVTTAILVFQKKETAAILIYQTNPPEIELYFCVNTFFCLNEPIWLLHGHVSENALYEVGIKQGPNNAE